MTPSGRSDPWGPQDRGGQTDHGDHSVRSGHAVQIHPSGLQVRVVRSGPLVRQGRGVHSDLRNQRGQ